MMNGSAVELAEQPIEMAVGLQDRFEAGVFPEFVAVADLDVGESLAEIMLGA